MVAHRTWSYAGSDNGQVSIATKQFLFCIQIHLQVCQFETLNPSSSYAIANESEQIVVDPTDSRGQIYLHYTGPGQDGSVPRYIYYNEHNSHIIIYIFLMSDPFWSLVKFYFILTTSEFYSKIVSRTNMYVFWSYISVILYRTTTVYLHCDQSRTTPIATASGEIDRIINYVSCTVVLYIICIVSYTRQYHLISACMQYTLDHCCVTIEVLYVSYAIS